MDWVLTKLARVGAFSAEHPLATAIGVIAILAMSVVLIAFAYGVANHPAAISTGVGAGIAIGIIYLMCSR